MSVCLGHAGLEVKVAFGSVWKQSLTELSGGQRSLLALSLILAMLLFKPAPLYILDEVSHLSHAHSPDVWLVLRVMLVQRGAECHGIGPKHALFKLALPYKWGVVGPDNQSCFMTCCLSLSTEAFVRCLSI